LLYKWKESHEQQDERRTLAEGEREELKRLRKVNKELRMEKEILKRPALEYRITSSRKISNKIRFYQD
jgi:transposase-like protein